MWFFKMRMKKKATSFASRNFNWWDLNLNDWNTVAHSLCSRKQWNSFFFFFFPVHTHHEKKIKIPFRYLVSLSRLVGFKKKFFFFFHFPYDRPNMYIRTKELMKVSNNFISLCDYFVDTVHSIKQKEWSVSFQKEKNEKATHLLQQIILIDEIWTWTIEILLHIHCFV